MLYFVARGLGVALRGLQAFRVLKQHQSYDWAELLGDLSAVKGLTSLIYKPIDLPSLYRTVAELIK